MTNLHGSARNYLARGDWVTYIEGDCERTIGQVTSALSDGTIGVRVGPVTRSHYGYRHHRLEAADVTLLPRGVAQAVDFVPAPGATVYVFTQHRDYRAATVVSVDARGRNVTVDRRLANGATRRQTVKAENILTTVESEHR